MNERTTHSTNDSTHARTHDRRARPPLSPSIIIIIAIVIFSFIFIHHAGDDVRVFTTTTTTTIYRTDVPYKPLHHPIIIIPNPKPHPPPTTR